MNFATATNDEKYIKVKKRERERKREREIEKLGIFLCDMRQNRPKHEFPN